MKKSIAITISIIIAGCFAWFIVAELPNIKALLNDDSEAGTTYLHQQASREYLALFKPDIKLRVLGTIQSKRRNPVTELIYNNSYYLNITRLGRFTSAHLPQLVRFSTSNRGHIAYHISYILAHQDYPLKIQYRAVPKDTLRDQLYLNMYGRNTVATVVNDSTVSYYSNVNNFSIRYAANAVYDVYASTTFDQLSNEAPAALLFMARHHNIYLVIMAPAHQGIILKADQLQDLINR